MITCGVDSFMESLQYIEKINSDVSNGKLMPQQIYDLTRIFLGAFTLSTTAVKVPSFKAGMQVSRAFPV